MKNLKKTVATLIVFMVVFFLPTPSSSSTKSLNSEPIDNVMVGGAYLTIAGKFGGDISKKELKDNYKMGVEGCAKGSLITNYIIQIKSNGKTVSIKESSNELKPKTLALLNELKKGDSFTFKNVKAKLPTGNTVDVVCKTFILV